MSKWIKKHRPPKRGRRKCTVVPPQFTAVSPWRPRQARKNMPYCCNGQTRHGLLAKKSFWCAARRMYSRRMFPSVSHRPTVLLRETLHRYLFPVIASCGVFYTCKAHLSRGFYKKVKIIFHRLLYRNSIMPTFSKISRLTTPSCEKGETNRNPPSVLARFLDL